MYAFVKLFLNFEPFGLFKTWFEHHAVGGYRSSAFLLYYAIDKLIEIGRCYGMEINVEKTIVMGI